MALKTVLCANVVLCLSIVGAGTVMMDANVSVRV